MLFAFLGALHMTLTHAIKWKSLATLLCEITLAIVIDCMLKFSILLISKASESRDARPWVRRQGLFLGDVNIVAVFVLDCKIATRVIQKK